MVLFTCILHAFTDKESRHIYILDFSTKTYDLHREIQTELHYQKYPAQAISLSRWKVQFDKLKQNIGFDNREICFLLD